MIKVIRKDVVAKTKNDYPCLKRSELERIVLFIAPRTGYELVGGETPYGFFCYSDDWREDVYELYEGTVELSNDIVS